MTHIFADLMNSMAVQFNQPDRSFTVRQIHWIGPTQLGML